MLFLKKLFSSLVVSEEQGIPQHAETVVEKQARNADEALRLIRGEVERSYPKGPKWRHYIQMPKEKE